MGTIETLKCDTCRYDVNTNKANDKCDYCRDNCNYLPVNKYKLLVLGIIYSTMVVMVLYIIVMSKGVI